MLSASRAETSHASASDRAKTMGAPSSNNQTTFDTFNTDDDHIGQHESAVEQDETGQKQEGNSVILKNTVTWKTGP